MALGPVLVPVECRLPEQHGAEGEPEQMGDEQQQASRRPAQIVRQQVDVHVPADREHVGAAEEGGGDDGVGDELGLPHRGGTEQIAHHHHLADDRDGRGDQERREEAESRGEETDDAHESGHAAPSRRMVEPADGPGERGGGRRGAAAGSGPIRPRVRGR
jgi:hypothetical protein